MHDVRAPEVRRPGVSGAADSYRLVSGADAGGFGDRADEGGVVVGGDEAGVVEDVVEEFGRGGDIRAGDSGFGEGAAHTGDGGGAVGGPDNDLGQE